MLVKSRVYITAGFVCVALGVIGIPMPLLPTTPFLLLAAYFFARGSERWHRWLMTHPTLSPYILAFRDRRGLTRAQKWRIAGLMTLTLIITGARPLPCKGRDANIVRLEIPYGRFERRIALSSRLRLAQRELCNGCLVLTFAKL